MSLYEIQPPALKRKREAEGYLSEDNSDEEESFSDMIERGAMMELEELKVQLLIANDYRQRRIAKRYKKLAGDVAKIGRDITALDARQAANEIHTDTNLGLLQNQLNAIGNELGAKKVFIYADLKAEFWTPIMDPLEVNHHPNNSERMTMIKAVLQKKFSGVNPSTKMYDMTVEENITQARKDLLDPISHELTTRLNTLVSNIKKDCQKYAQTEEEKAIVWIRTKSNDQEKNTFKNSRHVQAIRNELLTRRVPVAAGIQLNRDAPLVFDEITAGLTIRTNTPGAAEHPLGPRLRKVSWAVMYLYLGGTVVIDEENLNVALSRYDQQPGATIGENFGLPQQPQGTQRAQNLFGTLTPRASGSA
ncbi:hypothetical protein HDU99_009980 [Rhizoclosmatium hyalinum]|nr:hypothetical protein HDU99_009980 [Rhizoclosmatium hyalinum]